VLKTGEIRDLHYSNYKDGAYNYFTSLYMPPRCQTCLDGSGLFADVSVSDAWTRDDQGNYRFEAHSRMLARTELGARVVQQAIDRGTITARDVTRDPDYATHALQTKRKGTNAPLRTARRLRAGQPAPVYDRTPPRVGLREHAMERAVSALLYLGGKRWFRYPLMKFLTSAGAIPLIRFRLWRKTRKYRALAARKARAGQGGHKS
jgi:coenzyme F420 hydrogenase subunit beta